MMTNFSEYDLTIPSLKIIANAKYGNAEKTCVVAVIGGVKVSVPTDPANSHYEEMLKQVNDGTITSLLFTSRT